MKTTVAAAAVQSARAERLPIKKGIILSMFPRGTSTLDRFRMAREAGFEQMECHTTPDPKDADEIKKASEETKIRVHSVMNSDHWRYPLSSSDADVVGKSMKGMETSLRNANFWGADTVLLVPAVVNPQTGYKDAWDRSVRHIRELIPMASELKVVIAVEEVWNKFLLSPLEFANYVDQFNSPWVKAYFDVGNVVMFGYPQDWIRTLGKRIVKLHLKDFRLSRDPSIKKTVQDWVNLREGDINWKEVHKALGEIGYSGAATVELPGGDATYLSDLSKRVDLILEGA